MSSSRGFAISLYLIVTPDRSLVLGASTGAHFRDPLAGLKRRRPEFPAKSLQFLAIKTGERPRNRSIGLDQEHGGDVRKAVSITGRVTKARVIEQGRHGD